MSPNTQTVLRRIVDKAGRLRNSTFLAEIERGGWRISFPTGTVVVTRPPDESRDAFVLNLRFFILGNEATSFRSLTKLLDDPELSSGWKDQFRTLRGAVNDMLAATYGEYRIGGASHRFSNGQILDTFLYGGLVHANNPEAVARMAEWTRHPGAIAWLEMWFISTVRSLCLAIFRLSDLCEQELQLDSAGASPVTTTG